MDDPPPPPASGRGIRAALTTATARIADVSPTPRLDAELLMAHALGATRDDLLLRHLDAPEPPAFVALVARRLAHEPIAYITGMRAFWTIDLAVGPGVLIPRADSETLIEAAVAHFADRAPTRIVDLGTGSGALLLAALDQWPAATGVGIDASPAALAIARANADRLGMADRARFLAGGWDGDGGVHDLILCNPPYVEADADLPSEVADWEPASALFAGPDGLDDYRVIAPLLRTQMTPGGIAVIEIGWTQAEAVTALLVAAGMTCALHRDLAGNARCIVAT